MALSALFAGIVGSGIAFIMLRGFQLQLDQPAGSAPTGSAGYQATTAGLQALNTAVAQSPWLALIAVLAAVLAVGKVLS